MRAPCEGGKAERPPGARAAGAPTFPEPVQPWGGRSQCGGDPVPCGLWEMGGGPLGCFPLKNNMQGGGKSWQDPAGADVPPKLEQSSAALSATRRDQPGANCCSS